MLVLLPSRVLPDPGMPKEFLKVDGLIVVIVIAQKRTEQRLAKASRAQKDRVADLFQFGNILGLINKIAMIAHNRRIIGFAV